MPLHLLTNFEIQRYYQHESKLKEWMCHMKLILMSTNP